MDLNRHHRPRNPLARSTAARTASWVATSTTRSRARVTAG
jgi:hypothetical protein